MTWHEHSEMLDPIIAGVTHEYARKYHRYMEREDLRQELILWVVAHPNKVQQYVEEERDHSIVKSLQRVAGAYCQKEKAAASGYKVDDIYYWQYGDIEALLPQLFNYESWLNPPKEDADNRAKKSPNEGNGWVATMTDLSRAYATLPGREATVLRHVYGDGQTRVRVAEMWDVSDQTIHNWIVKSIKHMHYRLGGDRPRAHDRDCECGQVTGARKAISNAAAQALTNSYYAEG